MQPVDVVIAVDIRPQELFDISHIRGSHSFPSAAFEDLKFALPPRCSPLLVVHNGGDGVDCTSKVLVRLGFQRVTFLEFNDVEPSSIISAEETTLRRVWHRRKHLQLRHQRPLRVAICHTATAAARCNAIHDDGIEYCEYCAATTQHKHRDQPFSQRAPFRILLLSQPTRPHYPRRQTSSSYEANYASSSALLPFPAAPSSSTSTKRPSHLCCL